MNTSTPQQLRVVKGQELRRLRKERGLRQDQVAAWIRKTRETIGHWESGQWPDHVTEMGLAAAFDLPADYFAEAARRIMGEAEEQATTVPLPLPVAQLLQLYQEHPERVVGAITIGEIQKHLEEQISIFFRQVMPEGCVTVAGMEKALVTMFAQSGVPLPDRSDRRVIFLDESSPTKK